MHLKLKTKNFELTASTELSEAQQINTEVINTFNNVAVISLSKGDCAPQFSASQGVKSTPTKTPLPYIIGAKPPRVIEAEVRDKEIEESPKDNFFTSLKSLHDTLGRKLVHYRCSHCGQSQFTFTSEEDKPTQCYKCKEELHFTRLIPGFTECPNCGMTSSFYVQTSNDEQVDGDFIPVLDILCKACKSPIDLIYHQDHKRYESFSLNLKYFRKGGSENDTSQ